MPSAAPRAPPGPGGSPDPVVFRVYSDHSTMGLAARPAAIATKPAVPMSSELLAAGKRDDSRVRGRTTHAFKQRAGRNKPEERALWCSILLAQD